MHDGNILFTAKDGTSYKTYVALVQEPEYRWDNPAGGGWRNSENWDREKVPSGGADTIFERIRVSNPIWCAAVDRAKMGTWKAKRPFVVVAPLQRKLDFWRPVSAVA
jgi:hypothetical protein